ncbi:hypothetical protein AMTRI_Chr09g20260 [Amborella trichopoda]
MLWSHNASVVAKGGPIIHVLESQLSYSSKGQSDSTCYGVTMLQQLQRAIRHTYSGVTTLHGCKGQFDSRTYVSHNAPTVAKGGPTVHVLESQLSGSCKGRSDSTSFKVKVLR